MSAARRVCQIACIGSQTFTERKTAYDQCEGIATVGRALTVLVAEAEQHKQKKIVHNITSLTKYGVFRQKFSFYRRCIAI